MTRTHLGTTRKRLAPRERLVLPSLLGHPYWGPCWISVLGPESNSGSGTGWDDPVAHISDSTKNDQWEGVPGSGGNPTGSSIAIGGEALAVGPAPKSSG